MRRIQPIVDKKGFQTSTPSIISAPIADSPKRRFQTRTSVAFACPLLRSTLTPHLSLFLRDRQSPPDYFQMVLSCSQLHYSYDSYAFDMNFISTICRCLGHRMWLSETALIVLYFYCLMVSGMSVGLQSPKS